MEKGWLHRLFEAISEDGRSMRAISEAANCGPNYVQQMIKDGKDPGSARLAKMMDVLGKGAAVYIMTGVRMSEQDQELLKLAAPLDPSEKEAAMRFVRLLSKNADNP